MVGTVLKTFYQISFIWSVEFEVKALGDQGPNWSNVFHFTNGANHGAPGNRYPAVFVEKGTQVLLINSYVSGNVNYGWKSPELSQIEWTAVKIHQYQSNQKVFYQVFFNGQSVVNVENTTPATFDNMILYLSDPWHSQRANLLVKNLKYRHDQTCNYINYYYPIQPSFLHRNLAKSINFQWYESSIFYLKWK